MGKIYTGDFLKDHLGMAVIIGGLGAVLMLVPLIVLYMWVSDVTGKGTPLGDIIINVGFFLALFITGGAACFYLMWRGINEKLTVGDGGLAYEATFFNKRLSAMEIDKIMLFDKARPVIIYDAGEEKKRLKLPVWRSNDYADGLIEELKRMNPNIAVSDLRKSSGEEYSLDAFPET